MTHHTDSDWQRLTRYMADESSLEERLAVERWIAVSPERAAAVKTLRQRWDVVQPAKTTKSDEAQWAQLQAMIDAGAQARHPRAPSRAASWSGLRLRGLVATVAILVVLIGAIVFPRSHNGPDRSHTYATHAGQRSAIVLPDGAKVTLGPATTLTVSADPLTSGTLVSITGEALFAVVARERTPFTVRAGQVIARVLGTTFAVRHYPNEVAARVTVSEGRVTIYPTTSRDWTAPVVLTARMLGVVNDSGQVNVMPNVALDDYTAWASGRLIFDERPVHEILEELSRTYGARVQLKDSALAQRRVTFAVATERQLLESALDELTTILHAHYTKHSSGTAQVYTIDAGSLAPPASARHYPPISEDLQHGR